MSESVEKKDGGELAKGFKYGCGGALGVWVALSAIPLLLMSGCVLVYVFTENEKNASMEELRARSKSLGECERHAKIECPACTGFEHLADAVSGEPSESGNYRAIKAGDAAKVLGEGKQGCRRIELNDASRWWLPGSIKVKTLD